VQDQIATFRLIDNILGAVSLLVAAITIFIVTYVDLVNKRRQIGIERAIGIRAGAIVSSYVLRAWAYALAGIAAGLAIFRLAIVPLVRAHPFHFPNGPVTLATSAHEIRRDIVILLIVALVAAAAPAVRSVRLRIIDAIWGS
jgi:putative ABC transport system permease protein